MLVGTMLDKHDRTLASHTGRYEEETKDTGSVHSYGKMVST